MIGEYRNGWLVFTCDGPRFLYRSLFRTHLAALPIITAIDLRRGLVTDALDVSTSTNDVTRTFTIFLLKDGPSPRVAADELKREHP
jgi:hypothetical protein